MLNLASARASEDYFIVFNNGWNDKNYSVDHYENLKIGNETSSTYLLSTVDR
jgi:hypothetical protein